MPNARRDRGAQSRNASQFSQLPRMQRPRMQGRPALEIRARFTFANRSRSAAVSDDLFLRVEHQRQRNSQADACDRKAPKHRRQPDNLAQLEPQTLPNAHHLHSKVPHPIARATPTLTVRFRLQVARAAPCRSQPGRPQRAAGASPRRSIVPFALRANALHITRHRPLLENPVRGRFDRHGSPRSNLSRATTEQASCRAPCL
jgi:hypothetical protein